MWETAGLLGCFILPNVGSAQLHAIYIFRFLQLVSIVRNRRPYFHVIENSSTFLIRFLQSILNSQSITSQTIRTFQVIHQG